MKNILRLIILLIPVAIYLFSFYVFCNFKPFAQSLKNNWRLILKQAIIIALIFTFVIVVFFKLEDTIYSYDYSGHWLRSLRLKNLFWTNPGALLSTVYRSFFDEYSYLPALLSLPLFLFKDSYSYFVLTNFYLYYLPLFIIGTISYYVYFNKHKHLPLFIGLTFYPLYFTLFNGEVDMGGLFFLSIVSLLLLLPKEKDIKLVSIIYTNLAVLILLFFRRYYLFAVLAFYLTYFLKFIYCNLHLSINKKITLFGKYYLSSGLLALMVLLLFARPYLVMVLGNRFKEAYAFYNHNGKLGSLLNYLSLPFVVAMLLGVTDLFRKKKYPILVSLFSLVLVPLFLFWRIQSLEFHHYNIFILPLIMLLVIGLNIILNINKFKLLKYLVILILCLQPCLIFAFKQTKIPLLTNIKRVPLIYENKKEIIDLSTYLISLMPEKWQSAYLASGSYVFNDDVIRNCLLPDLSRPQIDSAILDLRDPFPNLANIQFVLLTEPTLYLDAKYQHLYDVIKRAITIYEPVKKLYQPLKSFTIDDFKVTIYERIGEFTPQIKEYFYREMLRYYPQHKAHFASILE